MPGRVSAQSTGSITQAAVATYDCGDGGAITIENNRTWVRVTKPGGETVDLPLSPESGGARFATTGGAVLIEGSEVLVMLGRDPPRSCTR